MKRTAVATAIVLLLLVALVVAMSALLPLGAEARGCLLRGAPRYSSVILYTMSCGATCTAYYWGWTSSTFIVDVCHPVSAIYQGRSYLFIPLFDRQGKWVINYTFRVW